MDLIYLAIQNELTWEKAITVTFSGICIVFGALIFLVLIFWLFSKVFGRKKKTKSGDGKAIVTQEKAVKTPAKVQKAPVVQDGIEEEVVAAITAAITAFHGGAFTVRSINRRQQGRPAWANAGILENTRPF